MESWVGAQMPSNAIRRDGEWSMLTFNEKKGWLTSLDLIRS